MNEYVLDAFALMTHLNEEQGWERVEELLDQSATGATQLHISAINLAEVQYRLLRTRPDAREVIATIDTLPLHVASADAYIPDVVELKAKHPISLADCFAAALARDLDCPLVTGDPEFQKLKQVIKVEWLR